MIGRRRKQRPRAGKTNTLRIIGGEWRNRRLSVIDSEGLRPTGERLRETLFNWLAPVIVGARCIDCFAGTGALGLEALSRGAARVHFMESDRQVAYSLQESINTLGATSRARLAATGLENVTLPAQSIDVAFVDPPFALAAHGWAIEHLLPMLAPQAYIYLEFPAAQSAEIAAMIEARLEILRDKRAGDVGFCLTRLRSAQM